MFVYSGKLTWRSSAKNETFVIIFPNGPVRTGDSVYLFSQWTKDSDGVEKKNWFENLPVTKVSKNSSGEDAFTLTSSWYSFTITVQKAYDSLSVNMSHHHWYPSLFSETIKLERVWQPVDKHPTGSTRIWTGKIKWRDFAKNELAMFILPDGVGEGKPVLSIWQWTKSSAQKEKDFQFRSAAQKLQSGADDEIVKFTFNSYYDINCTWNQKTEKLAVNMKEDKYSEDIGEMSLAVLIERHNHHFVPPRRASVEKKELEVRLPQAQSSLPRILTPLPFPDDIVQSLAQTVAFADHAGYLAKYAQDRFNALDADFHARGQQLDTLKSQNTRLEETIKQLGGKLHAGEIKAEHLAKSLADAQAAAKRKEDELNKAIHGLEDRLAKGAKHDKEDHNLIEKTRKALALEKTHCGELSRELEKVKVSNTVLQSQLKTAADNFIKLQGEHQALKTQYNVEKKHCQELHAANHTLKKDKLGLAQKLASIQLKLDAAEKLYQKSQNDLRAKDDLLLKEQAKVTQLEKDRAAVTAERDAAVKERDAAKTEAAKNLVLYEGEVKVNEQLGMKLKEVDEAKKVVETERDAAKTDAATKLSLYESEFKAKKQVETERDAATKQATTNYNLYTATKKDVQEARDDAKKHLTTYKKEVEDEQKKQKESSEKKLKAQKDASDRRLKEQEEESEQKLKDQEEETDRKLEAFKQAKEKEVADLEAKIALLTKFRDEYEELLIKNDIVPDAYPAVKVDGEEDTVSEAKGTASTVNVTAVTV